MYFDLKKNIEDSTNLFLFRWRRQKDTKSTVIKMELYDFFT